MLTAIELHTVVSPNRNIARPFPWNNLGRSCMNTHRFDVFWLIDYLGFYVPLKNISLIWRRHQCRWRAVKFRPMLGAQGLWAGRDLYRATPTATRDLGFSGLIRRTAPFSRLLRHTRGCGGSILTRILTGLMYFVIRFPPKHSKRYDIYICLQQ
jgi:hypothetical protein